MPASDSRNLRWFGSCPSLRGISTRVFTRHPRQLLGEVFHPTFALRAKKQISNPSPGLFAIFWNRSMAFAAAWESWCLWHHDPPRANADSSRLNPHLQGSPLCTVAPHQEITQRLQKFSLQNSPQGSNTCFPESHLCQKADNRFGNI